MVAERRALVVVDVQPTFCEGGELPVTGGNAVARAIATFVTSHRAEYAVIVTTQDWHVDPGSHFAIAPASPDYVDTWPPQGVADSPNAALHPALADLGADVQIKKGQFSAGYSGFDGSTGDERDLHTALAAAGITDLDVVGIAESHCVRATVIDGLALGYRVRVLSDLTVPVSEELGLAAREQMRAAGAVLTTSQAV